MDLFEYSHVKEVSDHLMVKFPYFAKTIEKRMDDFGEPWLADFDEELKIFFGDDLLRLRKAVYGYGTFALDAMKLQKKFDKMREYIPKSYADVSREVYHNRDYMCNLYLPGILLSQFLWPHHYRQLLFFRNQFLPRLRGRPNEVFCDIGVGTGFYSKEVLCAMPAIRGRGYDISEFSLEHTKMMIEKWQYQDRYQFYRTNILVDPPGEVADALVCVEVLEHLEDPVTFLKGLYAIIRPGGFGYITAAINAPNEEFVFTEENMKTFSDLTGDDAPIHWNSQFTRNRGYRDRLVFGLFVGARFSGLLGTKLPGPHTVLHSTKFQMAQPVYVGETILYRVKVEQVVVAVRAVVLSLEAGRPNGEVVLRGTAQCGFLK